MLGMVGTRGGSSRKSPNDLTNNIMLPVGGLLIALFVGWFVSRDSAEDELNPGNSATFGLWRFAIRYLVPPSVLVILYFGITG